MVLVFYSFKLIARDRHDPCSRLAGHLAVAADGTGRLYFGALVFLRILVVMTPSGCAGDAWRLVHGRDRTSNRG